jgi:hypothetical protein
MKERFRNDERKKRLNEIHTQREKDKKEGRKRCRKNKRKKEREKARMKEKRNRNKYNRRRKGKAMNTERKWGENEKLREVNKTISVFFFSAAAVDG